MRTNPTYVLKGKIKQIEMRVAHTKEGDKEYGTGSLEVETRSGKKRIVPILTFYPSGIDFLYMTKEGKDVEVFGTFTKIKGTNGTNKFFELIGRHNQKRKNKEIVPEIL